MALKLDEVIGDIEFFISLDVEELALRLLPWIRQLRQRQIAFALQELGEVYNVRGRQYAENALREAWAWLEGQALLIESSGFVSPNPLRVLSRRANALIEQNDAQRVLSAGRIRKDSLHKAISDDVWALYHRGKFDTAVFEAMKAVEIAVRDASDLAKTDIGVQLMRKAFDKNKGPLTEPSTTVGEKEARAHLFAGAIGSYKNPQSHRNVALDDPDEAAEIIMLANHLLRIVDSQKVRLAPV